MQLLDMERIDALIARSEKIDQAFLTNYAMNKPEQLSAERDALELALMTPPGDAAPAVVHSASEYSLEELVHAANALFSRHADRIPVTPS